MKKLRNNASYFVPSLIVVNVSSTACVLSDNCSFFRQKCVFYSWKALQAYANMIIRSPISKYRSCEVIHQTMKRLSGKHHHRAIRRTRARNWDLILMKTLIQGDYLLFHVYSYWFGAFDKSCLYWLMNWLDPLFSKAESLSLNMEDLKTSTHSVLICHVIWNNRSSLAGLKI